MKVIKITTSMPPIAYLLGQTHLILNLKPERL